MSLADLTAGFVDTLLWRGFLGVQLLRRDLTRSDLGVAAMDAIKLGLDAFWTAHGADIVAARGIVGLSRSNAWHAGHELYFVRLGIGAFDAAEWGEKAAAEMATTATSMQKVTVEAIDGTRVRVVSADRLTRVEI